MIRLADAIAPLADADVDRVVFGAASDIDTVAAVLGIDPHYLSVQVRIHIPYFERQDLLEGTGIDVIRRILAGLRTSLDDFGVKHVSHRERNGIDLLPRGSTVKTEGGELFTIDLDRARDRDLRVDEVDPAIGLAIQDDMHYIHSSRDDTLLHAGLFIVGQDAPIAYAAFSDLDRAYLESALRASGAIPEGDNGRIAVMTRAFGYNPLPKNAMSKLFDFATRKMSAAGYNYVITALNPLLGFKGSIFSGSSFIPFATSPMRYWYNEDGSYMNRRKASQPAPQRLDTPPIIWLVRGLDSRRQRNLESFPGPLYEVSQEQYDAR